MDSHGSWCNLGRTGICRVVGTSGPFSLLQGNILGQAGTTSFTDTNAATLSPLFYRVGVAPQKSDNGTAVQLKSGFASIKLRVGFPSDRAKDGSTRGLEVLRNSLSLPRDFVGVRSDGVLRGGVGKTTNTILTASQ